MPHTIASKARRRAKSLPTVSPALRALHVEIASCTTCPSLNPWRQFEPNAYGTSSTGYVLVGEAPGAVSLKKRRRLTGPAGMLLRRALRQLDHPRYRDLEDLFYMTDVVKCHPSPPGRRDANRSPRKSEVAACATYLIRELQRLAPSVVITLGKAAAEGVANAVALTTTTGFPSPRVIAFPHPSPRNQRTILQQYQSMRALEQAFTDTFRELIAGLEGSR